MYNAGQSSLISPSLSGHDAPRIGVTQALICRSLSFFDLDTFAVGLLVLGLPTIWSNFLFLGLRGFVPRTQDRGGR